MSTPSLFHSGVTKVITHSDSCVCYTPVLMTRSWDSWRRHIVVQGWCTCGFVIVYRLHMLLCTCPSYPRSPMSHQLKCTFSWTWTLRKKVNRMILNSNYYFSLNSLLTIIPSPTSKLHKTLRLRQFVQTKILVRDTVYWLFNFHFWLTFFLNIYLLIMSIYGLTWTVVGVTRGSVIGHAHARFP